MRFVDHQNIGCSRDPLDFGMRATFEGLAELVEAELFGKFAPPLLAQRRRGRDQYLGVGIVDQMLADDQPGLDCLAQPDLVGEEIALDRITEHAAHRCDLVRHEVDPGREQRRQTLSRTGQRSQRRQRGLPAVVQILAFGGAGREHFGRILGRIPRPDE
ncbi:hypothetical protein M3632_01045 [Sphingopyxis alaskensis]|nr:hypothetical protein [Sphingopyxis alaskensis]